jgi:hypothetical protein
MANELTFPDGMPITLQFGKANIGATATTGLTLVDGGVGLKVPTGYTFHPLMIHAEANGAVVGGTMVFHVTANTTASINGPIASLSSAAQVAVGVQRVGVEPIAAGKIVGANVVSASLNPTTLDVDVVISGVLTPA